MSAAVETLFLPFSSGDVDPPGKGDRFAFLNAASPRAQPDDVLKAALVCEQGFRPDFLALQRAGYQALPEFDAGSMDFAACLVLVGKHKGENHATIARACRLVKPGGTVVVCGDKTLGISSLRKWVSNRVETAGSLAKHHATVFWFAAPQGDAFADAVEPPVLADGRFETAPGMFSHARPDRGSVLLAAQFDARISGAVADFGCGWGYLAIHALQAGSPASLALFDAYYPSLKAAERNLAPVAGSVPVAGHWIDLTSEPVARQFDWIVMNPPFHSGRASEPDIGKAFIASASKALKPGGRLLMVANRKLPYEQALAQGFRRVEEKVVQDGYKVIEAMR
ncbi:MAG: class I SAM-dependent methyltransferase [Oricola sp.]